MPTATYLRSASDEVTFLANPPANLVLGEGESLVTETVTEAELAQLNDPRQRAFKLYDHVEGSYKPTAPPAEIDYRLLNLHRQEEFDKGLRVAVNYYAQSDGKNFSDLVIGEQHTYQYMPYRAIPLRRDISIQWYLVNETVGFEKTKTRHFYGTKGAKVHEKRKEANVMNLKAIIFGFYTAQLGVDEGLRAVNTLFGYLFQTIETYVKGHEGFLIDAIQDYEDAVLDEYLQPGVTLRQHLVSELTIPQYIPA